jgi:hypothetical protein
MSLSSISSFDILVGYGFCLYILVDCTTGMIKHGPDLFGLDNHSSLSTDSKHILHQYKTFTNLTSNNFVL